jgi:hypothetical protein
VRPRTLIAVLVVAIALLHAAWILKTGIRWSVDINRLSAWADRLIAHHFNFADYLHDTRFVAPPILYLGFVTVVAIAKVIAGSHWPALIVGLNWASVVWIATLVLTTVWRLTSSRFAVIVAGALLANFEMLLFVSFPMTDVLFAAIVTTMIVIALRAAEQPRVSTIIAGTAVLLLACVFRPAAAPLVLVWLVALLWPRLGPQARRWVVPVIAALLVIGAFVFAAVMEDVARWPFGILRRWLAYLKIDYDLGMIVVGRPDTWVAPPSSYFDYLAMIFRRWTYFFAIFVSGYSNLHKIANVLYFVPAYALAIAAILWRRSTAVTLLLLAILVTSAFHGMQEVDFDHRYRLPVIPPLIMLAAIGADELRRRFAR